MIKTETNSKDRMIGNRDLDKSNVSRIGTYAQYAVSYSTDVLQTVGEVVTIFPLDTREDWSIERVSDSRLRDSVISDQGINGWIGWIREGFYGFEQVESVYCTIDNEFIEVWIMIPDRDFSLVRKLIDAEMNFLDKFETEKESLYILEFHIIYRCNAAEASLIPYGAVRLPE